MRARATAGPQRVGVTGSARALIRGWCGRGAVEGFEEAGAPREEVDRLRDSGHPVKAALLLRNLDRGHRDRG